jgi:hypothetical protein
VAALHPDQILEIIGNKIRLPPYLPAMKSPTIWQAVLSLNPQAAARHDKFGGLPLYYGITSGKTWNDVIKDLFKNDWPV